MGPGVSGCRQLAFPESPDPGCQVPRKVVLKFALKEGTAVGSQSPPLAPKVTWEGQLSCQLAPSPEDSVRKTYVLPVLANPHFVRFFFLEGPVPYLSCMTL